MFQRLTCQDVWNVPAVAPAMNYASIGTRMLADERREEAEDKELLRKRRLQNLQQWRRDVEAAKAAGVKQYPYDPPLKFDESTARDPPRVVLPNAQRNRGRVY
jgi:hypothetical protein